jgi:hypothetical protein
MDKKLWAWASLFAPLLLAPFSATLWAAPVELDTPGAHIIVTRPVDEWSGDSGALSDSLDEVTSKKAFYRFFWGGTSEVLGGVNVFGRMFSGDDPVVVATTAELKSSGFAPGFGQGYVFVVRPALRMKPESFKDLVQAQSDAYRAIVLSQGDPQTLQTRIRARKVAGGVLSVLMVGLVGAKFGESAATGLAGSPVIGDVYQLPLGVPDALAPAFLPAFDSGPYKEMEIRSVTYRGGMTGQIIIAYTKDKTHEVETAALAKGIAACAGVGTTVEEIQKAREIDFEYRQAIWKGCVESGECKDGVYTPKPRAEAP